MCKCKCCSNATEITKGERGDQGPQGVQGEQGEQGEQGADGVQCCDFTIQIAQSNIGPVGFTLSATVSPATPGVTYEWVLASANNSMSINGSNTGSSISVSLGAQIPGLGIYYTCMETFRVIVRSQDGCCIANAYFDAFIAIAQ